MQTYLRERFLTLCLLKGFGYFIYNTILREQEDKPSCNGCNYSPKINLSALVATMNKIEQSIDYCIDQISYWADLALGEIVNLLWSITKYENI